MPGWAGLGGEGSRETRPSEWAGPAPLGSTEARPEGPIATVLRGPGEAGSVVSLCSGSLRCETSPWPSDLRDARIGEYSTGLRVSLDAMPMPWVP